jgi:tRNA A-37 threonylcarbamoyl transferase component Bud32
MTLFCVVVMLGGERLMGLLFHGQEYAGHGHVITVLAVAAMVSAVGSTASNALASMERPRAIVWVALVGAVLTVVLVWFSALAWGLVGTAYGFLAGSAAGAVARWFAFLMVVSRYDREPNPAADPSSMGMDSDRAAVIRVLQQLAPGCKTNDWVIEQLAGGVEANIYRVRCSDHHLPVWQAYRSVVIKLYKPWLSPDVKLVRGAFESLSWLYAALDGSTINGWKISVPAPLYICESPLALVTSMVTGKPLRSWLDHGNMPPEVFQSLPHAIIAAMNRFWSNGLLHGDLTLDNILCDVGGRNLSFVDAGMRRTCPFDDNLSSRWEPPSHDLAHMLYDTAVSVLSTIVSPVACFRRRMFAEGVVRAFVETIGSLEARRSQLEEIRACARLHLMDLDRGSWSLRGRYHVLQRQIGSRRIDRLIAGLRTSAQEGTERTGDHAALGQLSPVGDRE